MRLIISAPYIHLAKKAYVDHHRQANTNDDNMSG